MDSKNIVLVVGAGASWELGIPFGSKFLDELISRLCTSLNYNETGNFIPREGKYKIDLINQLLTHYQKLSSKNKYDFTIPKEKSFIGSINCFKEDLEEFIHKNFGSNIDSFLKMNPKTNYHDIGRFVLSYHMIGYEAHSIRESFYLNEDNWLRYFIETHLRKKITTSENRFRVKILTFNYDRSIEHHIFNFLQSEFNFSTENANKLIEDELEIVHIYGKIGDLNWQSTQKTIEFGARNDNHEFLYWAKENIKLIGWRLSDVNNEKIKSIISTANKIYILGFGYDIDNVTLLDLPKTIKIISTAYGLDLNVQDRIKKDFGLNNIEFLQETKCWELINNEIFSLI